MLWGDGDTVKDPVGSTYTKQKEYSAKDLLGMKDSLTNHYKKLMMIRKANPEIARGEYQALVVPDSKAGGFVCSWEGSSVAVLHNTTGKKAVIDLKDVTEIPFSVLAASVTADSMDGGASLDGTVLTLGPQTSAVLRTEPAE